MVEKKKDNFTLVIDQKHLKEFEKQSVEAIALLIKNNSKQKEVLIKILELIDQNFTIEEALKVNTFIGSFLSLKISKEFKKK